MMLLWVALTQLLLISRLSAAWASRSTTSD